VSANICIAGNPSVGARCGDPHCVCATGPAPIKLQGRDSARIRLLNDRARQAMGIYGPVYQTAGIAALDPAIQSKIRERVETFSEFTPDNDPYGEHDFGSFTLDGNRVFWKFDYYDRTMDFGSEDPANPAATIRVLTILLAEEY
jgi:hypothetical protein